MKWKVSFASDVCNDSKTFTARIDSMRDLEALYHKYGERLIVDFEAREIIIYDYYVE